MRIGARITLLATLTLAGCGGQTPVIDEPSRSASTPAAPKYTQAQLDATRATYASWDACLDDPDSDALLCTAALETGAATEAAESAPAGLACSDWTDMPTSDKIAYTESWAQAETGESPGFGLKSDLVAGVSSVCREHPDKAVDTALAAALQEFS